LLDGDARPLAEDDGHVLFGHDVRHADRSLATDGCVCEFEPTPDIGELNVLEFTERRERLRLAGPAELLLKRSSSARSEAAAPRAPRGASI
jgi:hypothetical protein